MYSMGQTAATTPPAMPTTTTTTTTTTLLHVMGHCLGVGVYLYGSYEQSQTHLLLRQLRTPKPSSSRQNPGRGPHYFIPYGRLFHYLSSPHYSCEILIYVGVCLVASGGSPGNGSDPWLWLGLLLTTSLNLGMSAWECHQWYGATFGTTYERLRRGILVPGVW